MNVEDIKESVSLTAAAELMGIHVEPSKAGQPCYMCGGSSSLKTSNNKYFKCYKCGASGSVIDFVIKNGVAATVSDTISYLSPIAKSKPRTTYNLELAYNIYKKNYLTQPDAVDNYLESRGWIKDIDCGYATENVLQQSGLTINQIENLQLMTDYGEYYNNHVIFPVYNEYGRLIHFNARALDNRGLRWKSTKGTPPIHQCFYNHQALYKPTDTYLAICEGVSDCLSLLEVDIPAIAQFGINVDLSRHAEQFSKITHLLFFYDFDKYPLGSINQGQYKSWSQTMPEIIKLLKLINRQAYYIKLPNQSGIKDVNDWLMSISYDEHRCIDYINANVRPIAELAIEMYKDDPAKHHLIWELLAATKDTVTAEKFYTASNPIEYLMELHR